MLVNIRFQVLFHSPPGVLFTFPSQYCSTIGHQVVFRLGGWAPRILTGFHVSADTLDTAQLHQLFANETVTPCGWLFHTIQLSLCHYVAVRTPTVFLPWFGLFRFRSPLLAESRLISLPMGT